MIYNYSCSAPINAWFFYQAWLAQRGQYPVSHYAVYPVDFFNLEIAFIEREHRDQFVLAWSHTFNV